MIDGYELTPLATAPDDAVVGLPADAYAQVRTLVAEAAAADGSEPLNEAALLNLRYPRPGIGHLWIHHTGTSALVGYAQRDDSAPHGSAQLVVAPAHRRRGLGRTLLQRLLADSPHDLQIWALGNTPAAQALARRAGLVARRTLLIMRTTLAEPGPGPGLAPGTTLRTFVPGQDESAWLAVNARAFAHHPEQGQITRADLEARMAEPWFDPAGFFVAERDGRLIGFHWTKEHHTAGEQLGEVYVLGVDPEAGGRGLGKALLAAGLRHLWQRGLTEVELYVEADHPAAVGLYRSSGFHEASRDVMYGPA